jgi:hypothetical protein
MSFMGDNKFDFFLMVGFLRIDFFKCETKSLSAKFDFMGFKLFLKAKLKRFFVTSG